MGVLQSLLAKRDVTPSSKKGNFVSRLMLEGQKIGSRGGEVMVGD